MGRRLFSRQPPAASLLMLFFACLALYQMHRANERGIPKKGIVGNLMSDKTKVDLTILPKEYDELSSQSQFCQDRFGRSYLKAFRQSSISYCQDHQPSQVTCFSNSIDAHSNRVDSFCIGGPSAFLAREKKFRLYCDLKETSDDWSSSTPSVSQFTNYWYETGPSYLFRKYIDVTSGSDESMLDHAADTTAILIKREDVRNNMWHGLMEIMSTYLTLDILRMTKDTNSSAPFFTSDDFNKTQIIILDNLADGPYIDAWNLFATKPILRLSNLTSSKTPVPFRNIITPLPGGSNPFWQGDWELLDCHSSPILRAFTTRMLTAYNIPIKAPVMRDAKPEPGHEDSGPPPIHLTFIQRAKTRRLLDAEKMLLQLKKRYNKFIIKVELIDYAKLPFEAQLRHTHHETDILFGVHGAGLTHGMFLRPGSAIIELMPPHLDHKGFRNMAENLEGIKYYRGDLGDRPDKTKSTGDWQNDNVWMDQDILLDLVGGVVDEMAKKRGLL